MADFFQNSSRFFSPLQQAYSGQIGWQDALAQALTAAGQNIGFIPTDEQRRLHNEAQSVMPQMADPAKQELSRQLMMGFGTGNLGLAGITAYHGSPYKFAPTAKNTLGEFDTTMSGMGEGEKAFGKGAYLAGALETGNSYKPEGGHLYKVDLPDEHLPKMLNWDKPLKDQTPEVKAAVQDAFELRAKHTGFRMQPDPEMKISDLMGIVGEGRLQDSGILGVKYLDAMSRGQGEGTSNYVLFDPSIANIIGRE